MKGVLALARKEGQDVLREKSIAVAIAVQAVVAAMSAFLAFGLLGLYDADSIDSYPFADVAYVGEGDFMQYLDAEYNLDVIRLDAQAALDAFESGALDMVVEEHTADSENARRVTLLVGEGEVATTLLLTQVKSLLQEYEDDLRIERSERLEHNLLEIDGAEPEGLPYAFMFATLLPLLVLTPVFLSGAVASDSFVQEVHQRTLQMLRSAPLSPAEILAGKLLTPVLLAPLQVLLWVGLLRLNDVPVTGVPTLLLWTAIMALLVCSLGLITGSVVRQEGQAQAAYALVAIMLGGISVWLPRDPLNVIALAGSGGMDNLAWLTIALVAGLAILALLAAFAIVGHRMRHDKL